MDKLPHLPSIPAAETQAFQKYMAGDASALEAMMREKGHKQADDFLKNYHHGGHKHHGKHHGPQGEPKAPPLELHTPPQVQALPRDQMMGMSPTGDLSEMIKNMMEKSSDGGDPTRLSAKKAFGAAIGPQGGYFGKMVERAIGGLQQGGDMSEMMPSRPQFANTKGAEKDVNQRIQQAIAASTPAGLSSELGGGAEPEEDISADLGGLDNPANIPFLGGSQLPAGAIEGTQAALGSQAASGSVPLGSNSITNSNSIDAFDDIQQI